MIFFTTTKDVKKGAYSNPITHYQKISYLIYQVTKPEVSLDLTALHLLLKN